MHAVEALPSYSRFTFGREDRDFDCDYDNSSQSGPAMVLMGIRVSLEGMLQSEPPVRGWSFTTLRHGPIYHPGDHGEHHHPLVVKAPAGRNSHTGLFSPLDFHITMARHPTYQPVPGFFAMSIVR